MLKQSICYPLFKDVADSPARFCELAAEMGYHGIDLWGREPLDDLAGPAADQGLTITGFVGHGPNTKGLNDPANHDEIQDSLREAIDLAAGLNVPTLIAFAGNRLPDQSDFDGLVQCARGLRPIVSHAEDRGVTICIELLNSKADHPLYLADNSGFGYALCEMVASPSVKLLFDIYHMQIMEGDIIRNITRGVEWIGHVHTAGVPGRRKPDHTQELNYPAIFTHLQKAGYTGFVGHEFHANNKLEAMRQAVRIAT